MKEVKFKDVPIGTGFGFGDYFHWKNTETTAVCDVSTEVNPWDPNITVVLMDEEDKEESEKLGWAGMLADDEGDFLCGKTCNPDAPEECESCQ